MMRPASASRAIHRTYSGNSGNSGNSMPRSPKSAYLTQQRSGSSLMDRYSLDIASPKSEASSPMLETKFSRKRAETDLQLLANRIALLKLEEQKALQKVHETKSRAEEVLETKRKHQEDLEYKLRRNLAKEQQTRAIQAKATQEREERRMKITQSQKMVYDSRRAWAEHRKEESKKLEEFAENGRVYTEYEKRKKAEEERRRKEQIRLQREQEKLERENEIRRKHLEKLEEEARKRREAEEMIQLLENEEKDLITRLRRTQQMQQDAYSILQRSLNN